MISKKNKVEIGKKGKTLWIFIVLFIIQIYSFNSHLTEQKTILLSMKAIQIIEFILQDQVN
jgi:hypothetical protein